MAIDPAGAGKDETAWAIVGILMGTMYVLKVVGTQGGYEDAVLQRIAKDAKTYGVHKILVESNFGIGMFSSLLKPHLKQLDHLCQVEDQRAGMMKEARIIQTLEPVMNQHRLVMAQQVIEEDDRLVQGYRTEEQYKYRLFYQLTRITAERGSLPHDDRLDALASAVAYWVDHMALDSKATAEKMKDKLREKDLKWHLENQLNAVKRPLSEGRRARKEGLFVR